MVVVVEQVRTVQNTLSFFIMRIREKLRYASVNQGRLMTTLGLRITGLHSAVPQWERGAVGIVTLYR